MKFKYETLEDLHARYHLLDEKKNRKLSKKKNINV